MTQLVFSTNNPNKIKEVELLLPRSINLLSLNAIFCTEELPETSITIKGNAIQKAAFVYNNYGYNCFADDTGLEIEALNGEPGVFSARYAGEQKNNDANITKVLLKLGENTYRQAHFKTVIALIIDGETTCFEGIINGQITKIKKGNNGFGYDSIFMPDGYEKTFAEMDLTEKNKISHRGIAFTKLVDFLSKK